VIRLSFLSIGVLGRLDRVGGIFGRLRGVVIGGRVGVTSCLSEVFIVIFTFERNRALWVLFGVYQPSVVVEWWS